MSSRIRRPRSHRSATSSSFRLLIVALAAVLYVLALHRWFSILEQRAISAAPSAALSSAQKKGATGKKLSEMESVSDAMLHIRRVSDGLRSLGLHDSPSPLLLASGDMPFHPIELQLLEGVLTLVMDESEYGRVLKEAERAWEREMASRGSASSHVHQLPQSSSADFSLLRTLSQFRSVLAAAGAPDLDVERWRGREKSLSMQLNTHDSTVATLGSQDDRFLISPESSYSAAEYLLQQEVAHHLMTDGHQQTRHQQRVGILKRRRKLVQAAQLSQGGVVDDSSTQWLFYALSLWGGCCGGSDCEAAGDEYEVMAETIVRGKVRSVELPDGGNLSFVGLEAGGQWLPFVNASAFCELPFVLAMGLRGGVHRRPSSRLSEQEVLASAESLFYSCLVLLQLSGAGEPFLLSSSHEMVRATTVGTGGQEPHYTPPPYDRRSLRTMLLKSCGALYAVTQDFIYGRLARQMLWEPSSWSVEDDSPVVLYEFVQQHLSFALLFSHINCQLYQRKGRGACSLFAKEVVHPDGFLVDFFM